MILGLLAACWGGPGVPPVASAPAVPRAGVARLRSALAAVDLCLASAEPTGVIVADDELQGGAPLCGDPCRTPVPLTTSPQRHEVYDAVLFPMLGSLEKELPRCATTPAGRVVWMMVGFQTSASDRHVGLALTRLISNHPFGQCNAQARVEEDPQLALDLVISDLANDLARCVRETW